MHLINNQIYIDLETHLDMTGLQDIEKDIHLGIVKSKHEIWDGGAAKNNFYQNEYQHDKKSLLDSGWPEIINSPRHINYEYYKKLNFDPYKCRMFNRYDGEYLQMGQALELRTYPTKQFHLKGQADACTNTPSAKNFPELLKWIYNIHIFKEIGRILFFFNSPFDKHAIHKDNYEGSTENFILINLHPERKEFFIMDDDGKEHITTSRALVFNPRNYHGTRGKEYYSWSLRIDGTFDESFCRSIGIWDHFK